MNLSQAYFCGEWMPLQDARIPLSDVGFGLGVTVVERLRTFAGRPFRVEEHFKRLQRSLEIVGWNAEAIVAEVRDAVAAFPDVNAELMAPGDDWYVAVFVTPGDSPRVFVTRGTRCSTTWS